ncbi:MAG: hypothetical protein ACYS0I_21455 [Planctomycetota bacterium]|jgi:hypothetical protein
MEFNSAESGLGFLAFFPPSLEQKLWRDKPESQEIIMSILLALLNFQ